MLDVTVVEQLEILEHYAYFTSQHRDILAFDVDEVESRDAELSVFGRDIGVKSLQ